MNAGSKSPKLHFLPRMMSQKKRLSKYKVEETQPLTEELKKSEYIIPLSEFKNEYKKLSSNDFANLKKEYKKLINDSMLVKENQYSIFSAVESLSTLNINGNSYIIQVENLRITLSTSLFSNTKLDAVFIPDKVNPKVIEYIVCQDPFEDSIFDFLQMIWEQEIPFMITLTKILKRKINTYEYWASKVENESYSKNNISYTISKKKELTAGNLTERLFIIEKNITEHREITQFHLTTSKNQSESVLNVYEKLFIKLHEIKSIGNCYPLLFHSSNSNLDQCSMLICIDKIISNLVIGSQNVNIYNTMLELNQYRNLMLQQESHYLCIYEYIDWFLRKAIKVMKNKKRSKTRSLIDNN